MTVVSDVAVSGRERCFYQRSALPAQFCELRFERFFERIVTRAPRRRGHIGRDTKRIVPA
jgi:hypothetical protein